MQATMTWNMVKVLRDIIGITANMVMFTGWKIRDCDTEILCHVVIFAVKTNTPSYLCHGVISTWEKFLQKKKKNTTAWKIPNLPPGKNFHVYSFKNNKQCRSL